MFSMVLAASLAGCVLPDDKVASLLAAPGKYDIYTCPEIVHAAKANVLRRRELEQLMAQASVDSGGRLVSALAYRSDYLANRGDMKELQEAAAAKQCDLSKIEAVAEAPAAPPAR
jgi:hypothetical protein